MSIKKWKNNHSNEKNLGCWNSSALRRWTYDISRQWVHPPRWAGLWGSVTDLLRITGVDWRKSMTWHIYIYINYHIWHMDNIWHMDMVYLTVKGMITSWGLLLVHYRFGSYRIHPYPCGDLMYQNVWKCLVYFFLFNPTALVWDARPNL